MAKPPESKPVLHTKKHMARLERERRQTRIILIAFGAIIVSVVGLLLYALLYPKYIQPNITIARVGDVKITVGEWQARVRLQRQHLISQLQIYQQYAQYLGMDLSSQEQQIQSQLDSPSTLGKSVLDQMVDEELIRQEAAKRGITASTQETDGAIQAAFRYYPAGTPTPSLTPTPVSVPTLSPESLALVTITPTPTAILTATASPTPTPDLKSTPTVAVSPSATPTAGPTATASPTSPPPPTATPYTLQGFEETYKNSVQQVASIGLTANQVRGLYESNVLHDKLFSVITSDVPRTQEQVWARHILVADAATAGQVRQRLINGEDFAKVAAQVSTDTGTKDKGGDLGWFGKGAMVAEFEAAAFSLKVGEISQPIQTQFGYHIIQVLAHTDMPLDASAYSTAQQTAFTAWLQKARDQYKVVTYDNWQDIVPTDPAVPTPSQQ
jgi:peptidyl-prolyl cis-trans isomerase D